MMMRRLGSVTLSYAPPVLSSLIAKHLSMKIGTTFCIREEMQAARRSTVKGAALACTSHCSGTIVRAT